MASDAADGSWTSRLMSLVFGSADYDQRDEEEDFLRTLRERGLGGVAVVPAAETLPATRHVALSHRGK